MQPISVAVKPKVMNKFKPSDAADLYDIMNEEQADKIINSDSFRVLTGTDVNMLMAAIEAYPYLLDHPISERLTDET